MYFGRGKNKVVDPYTFRDMYPIYMEGVEGNNTYECEYQEYVDINSDFYKSMMDHILEKSGSFKLPYNLGELSVLKRKVDLLKLKTSGLDWKTTNEIGKNVYHLNEHTSGFKYNFQWNKKGKRVTNLYLYRLVMTRSNKRRLAKLIKSGDYDYFEK